MCKYIQSNQLNTKSTIPNNDTSITGTNSHLTGQVIYRPGWVGHNVMQRQVM